CLFRFHFRYAESSVRGRRDLAEALCCQCGVTVGRTGRVAGADIAHHADGRYAAGALGNTPATGRVDRAMGHDPRRRGACPPAGLPQHQGAALPQDAVLPGDPFLQSPDASPWPGDHAAGATGAGPGGDRPADADSRGVLRSAYALVGCPPVKRAEHPLPELDVTGIEGAGAAVQVIAPHAVKALVVARRDLRPVMPEVSVPGPQRAGIVGAETVHIFGDEMRLRCRGDL